MTTGASRWIRAIRSMRSRWSSASRPESWEHHFSSAFHDRVIVTRDGARVFLYAGSREQAEGARELVLTLAEHGWSLNVR